MATNALGPHRDPSTVAVVMADGLPLLEMAVPGRIFGLRLDQPDLPRHTVLAVTVEDASITTSDGITLVPPHGIEAIDRAGLVVVPTWHQPGSIAPPERLLAALRQAHRDGAVVAGLCLGAFVVAAAGLLQGRRATTHWAYADALAATYPDITVDGAALYIDEGAVLTSAGSAAGIDACLHLLRRGHGAAAAATVARALVVAPHRTGNQAQFIPAPIPPAAHGDALDDVIAHTLANLAQPADIDALARRANMSRRTFDRRFSARTGSPPLKWLLTQRVLLAQHLLESTSLPVDVVARRTGFSDAVALRPHFRRLVGIPPQAYRQAFADSGDPTKPEHRVHDTSVSQRVRPALRRPPYGLAGD
ncbi:helix-turn-helix domain-containing protein [Streptomyces sp. NBC_01235]|uniref:helix-turn-helix domain-containing protein n=1 Tax=Streptomyces sp. NBC_01235 TaxID=2903788 RepID=UPI002E164E4A|nr:helix-turn-helix domain-containing protein [Streptomyces sp. NBC_01235]